MMQRVVIINCFDTYEHRATMLKRYFADRGAQVHVITSDWRHFQKTVRTDAPEGFELLHVKPYHKNLSAARLYSHHNFARDALTRAEQLRPQLLWILVPPNSLVKCAAGYKKAHPETKLVLDFIDMWPETMPISKFKTVMPFSWWRDLRDNFVQACDAAVTECALYQRLLEKKCGKDKMHTLYLARDIVPLQPVPDLPKDRISLCYLGSINNIIDIPCIGEIIRGIPAPVELHIIGDGEKREMLVNVAAEAGANVIFHGKVYDSEEKKNIFDRCHFGLNIMKQSVFVGLTMKSMDYFEYGVPLINNIRGDTWDFVQEHNLGLNYGAATQFDTEELYAIAQQRDRVRGFFENYFSYEKFEDAVNQIVSSLEGPDSQ